MKAIRFHEYDDPGVLRYADQLAALAKRVDAGELRVEISATYPLSQAAAVHDLAAAGQIRGKVLLTPTA